MCFRLLAALRPEATQTLERAAAGHGLDVRVAAPYVEIAWGDCACSLYTRREGRARVVAFLDELFRSGHRVQLLLFSDGESFTWDERAPDRVAISRLRAEGLAALPDARVAEIDSES